MRYTYRPPNCLYGLVALCFVAACETDQAWVAKKGKSGGRIGYYQSAFSDDRAKVLRDFNKSATKICRAKKWVIVREIIPPPSDAIDATRSATSGDAKATLDNGSSALAHDFLNRAHRVDKNVKVEYGAPFKTWNEAEIKCQ